MSTIAIDYLISLPVRRSAIIRLIIVLVLGFVLVTSIVWVAATPSVKVDSSSVMVAVPVPVAPAVDAQIQPAATETPAPSPAVIAVPVATSPSQ